MHPCRNAKSALERLRGAPPWAYCGGLIGLCYVLSAILLVEPMGFAAFQLCAVLGMLTASLIADALGVFGLAKRRPTAARLGALVALAGGALVASDALWEPDRSISGIDPHTILLALAACLAGAALPLQGALNGVMAEHLESPLRATSVSSFGGMLALWLSTLASALNSPEEVEPIATGEPWMYSGGLLGSFMVCTNVVGSLELGAAATASAGLSSQLFTALLLDAAGALGAEAVEISARRGLGVLLAMCAAIAFQMATPTAAREHLSHSGGPEEHA